MIEAHQFDGMVMLPRLRQDRPRHVDGRHEAETSLPSSSRAGPCPGKRLRTWRRSPPTWELIAAIQTGRFTEDELMKIEEAALPGVGTCSMPGNSQYHELSGRGPGHEPARLRPRPCGQRQKRRIAKQSGRRIVAMVKEDLTPPQDHDPRCPAQRHHREHGHGRIHQQHPTSARHCPRGRHPHHPG